MRAYGVMHAIELINGKYDYAAPSELVNRLVEDGVTEVGLESASKFGKDANQYYHKTDGERRINRYWKAVEVLAKRHNIKTVELSSPEVHALNSVENILEMAIKEKVYDGRDWAAFRRFIRELRQEKPNFLRRRKQEIATETVLNEIEKKRPDFVPKALGSIYSALFVRRSIEFYNAARKANLDTIVVGAAHAKELEQLQGDVRVVYLTDEEIAYGAILTKATELALKAHQEHAELTKYLLKVARKSLQ